MKNLPKTPQLFLVLLLIIFNLSFENVQSQTVKNQMAIIAYYMGDGNDISNYKTTTQLTHIIYSFLHLKGNKLMVDNAGDSLAITRLVALKQMNPKLKIILSLGGWGGCPSCSDVFNSEIGRQEFAESVLQLFKDYKTDGLDLDWEYPAIASIPDYTYRAEDKENFTALVSTLRKTVGPGYELSFAAGGFDEFLEKSIDWTKVMPFVNYVNIMTYDFVNGYSKHTGHLTSLYSTPEQPESVDYAVKFLDSAGVPANKIVIGLAFYARLFSNVEQINNGLYQKGKFSGYIVYKDFENKIQLSDGYTIFWDSIAKAPYAYNKSLKTFATFDNDQSAYLKTQYAKEKNLGGVMFWELHGDKPSGGLLNTIFEAANKK